MNNRDWLFHVGQGNWEGVMLMLQSLDPEEICMTCSPLHVKSVLEDLRSVGLAMTMKLKAQKEQA